MRVSKECELQVMTINSLHVVSIYKEGEMRVALLYVVKLSGKARVVIIGYYWFNSQYSYFRFVFFSFCEFKIIIISSFTIM